MLSKEIYCVKLPFGEGPNPLHVEGEMFRFPLLNEGVNVWCFPDHGRFLSFYVCYGGEVADWETLKPIYLRMKGAH